MDKSNFPISRNRPSLPRHLTDACNASAANEFSTRSTPLPLVCLSTCCSNDVSRELAIFASVSYNREIHPSETFLRQSISFIIFSITTEGTRVYVLSGRSFSGNRVFLDFQRSCKRCSPCEEQLRWPLGRHRRNRHAQEAFHRVSFDL